VTLPDQQLPFGVQEHGREIRDTFTIVDISYASPQGGRVSAYMIVPQRSGQMPALLFAHPSGLDRHALLDEAELFAQGGAISLLIDAPHARRPDQPVFVFTQADSDEFAQAAAETQRGIDLLLTHPEVDPARVGFVGFSYGAVTGALLAGVERRIKAYILWSCVAQLGGFLRGLARSLPADTLAAYLEMMAPLDPIRHVGKAAPSALLLQNGRKDRNVPVKDGEAMYEAASQPKEIMWYDAGHGLSGKARQDRYLWLQRQLGFDSPSPALLKALGRFKLKTMMRRDGD
jgi:dipeptidyl aminopeptidase/acylaminoacyl peptidase